MKRLVIFDLDGTLLNTIDDLGNAANFALEQCGFPQHTIASYRNFVGNGVTKLLERSLPEDVRSETNVERLRKYFFGFYDEHNTDLSRPYPGIISLLSDLRAEGIAIAVASNKYQTAVDKLIRYYFSEFDWAAIEGQKDDCPIKPDPSVIFNILATYPTPKSEVLYVGDSGVDMETARRACVESAGVTWGFRHVRELRESHADHIVHSTTELLSLAVNAPVI